MELTREQVETFQAMVLAHYDANARHELPWRHAEPDGSFDPYKIWVSELMLQQTQVNRVIPKYLQFLQHFPNVQILAKAELGEVLIAWQGLGYNRRAKYLWQVAQQIVQEYDGRFPQTAEELATLPGIGMNTAGAIVAYAYNRPALFVETNIRSVYFHYFFADQTAVSDKQLLAVLGQTLDVTNPRAFYWALMDYGAFLKQRGHGGISKSKHYTKQSKFEGSVRQIRGQVLRLLGEHPMLYDDLIHELQDDRAASVIKQLEREQMIRRHQDKYRLA